MFTVVIPLYNKEISIKNTIDSVLKQTYQDFEIIVINDGSTDDSAKVVENIDDNRIKLVHQNNQGVSSARNKGIKIARNEWIAFLDGDDIWRENHLEEITRMMINFPDEKVYATSFKYSNIKNIAQRPYETKIYEIKNYFKEIMYGSILWTSVTVINKQCFKKVGTFNTKLNRGEDLDLWARLAKNYTIIKSSAITAIYRIEAENRTSLSKKIEETHVYYFDLDSVSDIDEKEYYKALILNRLYTYTRYGDLSNVIKLKKKYEFVTWLVYIEFIFNKLKKRYK